jgi:hypothetical protein
MRVVPNATAARLRQAGAGRLRIFCKTNPIFRREFNGHAKKAQVRKLRLDE